MRRAPKGPTKAQREEHEALHAKYEAWCRHCVRGRGRNKPHRNVMRDDEEERRSRIMKKKRTTINIIIPKIAKFFDFLFS